MRKFTFKGTSCNLGRFGPTETGTVLTLTLQETRSVQGNPDFEPYGPDEPLKPVQLRGTGKVDLRAVHWEHKKLASYLQTKFSRKQRVNIAKAMLAIGCDIVITGNMRSRDISATIAYAGVRAGWDTLTKDERWACPGAEEGTELDPELDPDSKVEEPETGEEETPETDTTDAPEEAAPGPEVFAAKAETAPRVQTAPAPKKKGPARRR